jgi:hypothetical protein
MLTAPFNPKLVRSLNEYQVAGDFHPYTCPCGETLVATRKGLVCLDCKDFLQNWVHDFDYTLSVDLPPAQVKFNSKVRIINCKKQPGGVSIMRGMPLGNPWTHIPKGIFTSAQFHVDTREEAVYAFERHMWKQLQYDSPIRRAIDGLVELFWKGDVVLRCCCAPSLCHGESVRRGMYSRFKFLGSPEALAVPSPT